MINMALGSFEKYAKKAAKNSNPLGFYFETVYERLKITSQAIIFCGIFCKFFH